MNGKVTSDSCPLCCNRARHFSTIDGVSYFECPHCDFIFADPALLARMDRGDSVRTYDDSYWREELGSARQRSQGSSLARLAEAIYYCRIPINNLVDIGTGPGFLLDSFSKMLPSKRNMIHGFEKFPPREGAKSLHPNYCVADVAESTIGFECGTCIEVLEHLTPAMAKGLAQSIARVSAQGSIFMFNTGLTDYVRHEDPGYLDPFRRGHVTVWSVSSARAIFSPFGFTVHPLRGKTWAFVLEFAADSDAKRAPLEDRIWSALPQNLAILEDEEMGSVLRILGLESARAY